MQKIKSNIANSVLSYMVFKNRSMCSLFFTSDYKKILQKNEQGLAIFSLTLQALANISFPFR